MIILVRTRIIINGKQKNDSVCPGALVNGGDMVHKANKRPLVHELWMAVSDQRKPDGELLSEFTRSGLWIRRLVRDVAMLHPPLISCVKLSTSPPSH